MISADSEYTKLLRERVQAIPSDRISSLLNQAGDSDGESQFGLLNLALSAGKYAGGNPIGTAAIATTLYPLVKDQVDSSTAIYVVGSDGPNICKEDYPWKDYLKEWLEKGIQVHYLLVDPAEKAIQRLTSLREECVEAEGRLQLWIASPSVDQDGDDASEDENRVWLKRLETTHFAAFQAPSMLWLEADHPQGVTKARGCVFYGEDSRFGNTVARTLIHRFDKICDSKHVQKQF